MYKALLSARSDFNSISDLSQRPPTKSFLYSKYSSISIVIHLLVFLWYRRLNNAEDVLSPSKRRQQIGIFFLVGVGFYFNLWRRQQVVTLRDIRNYMDMHSSASAKIRKRKQKKENENKNHKKSGRKLTHFPKKMFSTHRQNQ